MTTTRTLLARRITKARTAKGVTMYRAALMAGMPPNTWSGYERRGKEPSLSQAVKVADVLDVTLDWLAGR